MAKLPRGLRIDRRNRSIFDLPADHPAPVTLIRHGECRRDCVGKELDDIDQSWDSAVMKRPMMFSGYAYCCLSFTLILRGWLEHPPHVTEDERRVFQSFTLERAMLAECEVAAERDENTRVLSMIAQSRQFYDTWEAACRLRLKEDGITP